ncbi:MAG: fasciclin domain-containing protein [Bacteroidia bacterium]|nr:fasciclin domain-containing protein [Bacteroidia bacterium]
MGILLRILFSLLLLSFIACEEEPDPGPTMYDSIAALPNTTSFIAAIDRLEFDDDFRSGQAITVFVPTDAAFDSYLSQNNFASLNDVPLDDLRNLLRYHILPVAIELPALGNGYYLTASSVGGTTNLLAILVENPGTKARLNKNIQVVNQDLAARGGFYNIIDEVLNLPTILSILRQNDAFEEFANGIFRAEGLADSLENNGLYTLLVTANTNVENALDDRYGLTNILDLPDMTLDSLMRYHIIKGNQRTEDLLNASDFIYETLLEDVKVEISGVDVIRVDGEADLILADIQTTNGVVHISNALLDFRR